MGDLAAKLAQATGCADGACHDIRAAVVAAFEQALEEGGSSEIALALSSAGDAFATAVTCGDRAYLTLSHPRAS